MLIEVMLRSLMEGMSGGLMERMFGFFFGGVLGLRVEVTDHHWPHDEHSVSDRLDSAAELVEEEVLRELELLFRVLHDRAYVKPHEPPPVL